MSYIPAEITILNEVGNRLLNNISTSNGYNNDFKKVKRSKVTPFKGYDLPAINYYHTSIDVGKKIYKKNQVRMSLIVEVHSKTLDDDFIDAADLLVGDIVTGLFRDTDDPLLADDIDYNLGGIVQKLNYLGHDPFIGQGQEPFFGSMVKFEIEYQTNIGDVRI